jgi:hypothetical protein
MSWQDFLARHQVGDVHGPGVFRDDPGLRLL